MSSSKRAKTVRRKPARAAAKSAKNAVSVSGDATRLAAAMERALAAGRSDALSSQAFQALTAALCRTYAAQIEAGGDIMPLPKKASIAPTDVMVMASGLLKSANLAVFELGMWQSWTGR
jgi:hypothetical protein